MAGDKRDRETALQVKETIFKGCPSEDVGIKMPISRARSSCDLTLYDPGMIRDNQAQYSVYEDA